MDGIDLFGGKKCRVRDALRKKGFRAETFDIVHGGALSDLSSKGGFENLFYLALRLVANAIIVLGPPCSLFVYMSCSQHLRHIFSPWGAPWDYATALSNTIAQNTVPRLLCKLFCFFGNEIVDICREGG